MYGSGSLLECAGRKKQCSKLIGSLGSGSWKITEGSSSYSTTVERLGVPIGSAAMTMVPLSSTVLDVSAECAEYRGGTARAKLQLRSSGRRGYCAQYVKCIHGDAAALVVHPRRIDQLAAPVYNVPFDHGLVT